MYWLWFWRLGMYSYRGKCMFKQMKISTTKFGALLNKTLVYLCAKTFAAVKTQKCIFKAVPHHQQFRIIECWINGRLLYTWRIKTILLVLEDRTLMKHTFNSQYSKLLPIIYTTLRVIQENHEHFQLAFSTNF